jgi:hypothetical protein
VFISNVPVKLVCINWVEKKQLVVHHDEVTVGIRTDLDTDTEHLRIAENQQVHF